MNWHQMLANDNRNILNNNGVEIDVYGPNGEHYEVKGTVIRIDSIEDPQTGQRVYEPRIHVSIHATDLPVIPKKDAGWIFDTTDVYGVRCRRYIIDVRNDQTIGFISMFGESYTESTPFPDPVTFNGDPATYEGETITYTTVQEELYA